MFMIIHSLSPFASVLPAGLLVVDIRCLNSDRLQPPAGAVVSWVFCNLPQSLEFVWGLRLRWDIYMLTLQTVQVTDCVEHHQFIINCGYVGRKSLLARNFILNLREYFGLTVSGKPIQWISLDATSAHRFWYRIGCGGVINVSNLFVTAFSLCDELCRKLSINWSGGFVTGLYTSALLNALSVLLKSSFDSFQNVCCLCTLEQIVISPQASPCMFLSIFV